MALPCLFAFPEHDGAEPTSNAAERDLRRGPDGEWSWFMTCVLTWGLRGRSVMDEVSRIIHGR